MIFKTTDGAKLKGTFYQHPNHLEPNSRVVILFHGNGDFYQSGSWYNISHVLTESPIPISYFCFNPRGIGESEGYPNASNLLLDAESAYQYVRDHLGISEDRIDLYGHSLGGAQAAQLKAFHPDTGGKLILDRTFANLCSESEHFISLSGFNFNIVKKLVKFLINIFDWNFQSDKAISKVTDPVYIFSHQRDHVIPPEYNITKTVKDWQIKPDNFHLYEFNDLFANAHNKPLKDLEAHTQAPYFDPVGGFVYSGNSISAADFLKRAYDPCWEVKESAREA